MEYPKDWRTNYQLTPSSDQGKTEIGHNEIGGTVCLHSLAVHPDFQKKGLGAVLLKGWTQRIRDAGLAKRIALICREKFVGFYEKAGFKKIGESKCGYAGGGWLDMVMEFEDGGDDDEL
jgi:ribosomal protein S18 acetylase RimI-like enzyme